MIDHIDNVTLIAVHDAQQVVADMPPGATLEQRLRAAMDATRDHWLCTREPAQFQAAVAAVMLHYGQGSAEWDRLGQEHRAISRVSHVLTAAQAGVVVDLASTISNIDAGHEPVGLLMLWRNGR